MQLTNFAFVLIFLGTYGHDCKFAVVNVLKPCCLFHAMEYIRLLLNQKLTQVGYIFRLVFIVLRLRRSWHDRNKSIKFLINSTATCVYLESH